MTRLVVHCSARYVSQEGSAGRRIERSARVERFGWFAHPQRTRENADGGLRINYGILDQIAALQWIQKSIAAFGGDAGNVTLIGESAGGVSIDVLNTSPLTHGLYHKAIVMSGANGGDFGSATLADARSVSARQLVLTARWFA
jgi:para-nitrobenzyl esterase